MYYIQRRGHEEVQTHLHARIDAKKRLWGCIGKSAHRDLIGAVLRMHKARHANVSNLGNLPAPRQQDVQCLEIRVDDLQ
jgi:hypothetical protein